MPLLVIQAMQAGEGLGFSARSPSCFTADRFACVGVWPLGGEGLLRPEQVSVSAQHSTGRSCSCLGLGVLPACRLPLFLYCCSTPKISGGDVSTSSFVIQDCFSHSGVFLFFSFHKHVISEHISEFSVIYKDILNCVKLCTCQIMGMSNFTFLFFFFFWSETGVLCVPLTVLEFDL